MKSRYLAAFASVALALCAQGRTLTPAEALQRAASEGDAPLRTMLSATAAPRLIKTTLTPSGLPAAYLFDAGSRGFAVLAADDVAEGVLGYGKAAIASGEAIPENVEWWLNEYAAQIEYASAHPATASYVTEAPASRPAIAPIVATRWDQEAPYNNQCPTISGKRTVTGCTATAMAQIMKYHNWPAAGKGSISYTDSDKHTYSMTFGTLDWSNMLNSYTAGSYTTAQGDAVAYLMKSCGYSIETHYTADASGATATAVVNALTEYFDYDKGVTLIQRENYGINDWEDRIYANLRDVGPVLYTGASPDGSEGHAFVCDGYSADGYFHINWGWSGMFDGYFRLTALKPEGLGVGGGSGLGFNFYQEAVLGIQPPKAGTTAPAMVLTQLGDLAVSVSGNTLTLKGDGENDGFFNLNSSTEGFFLGVMIESADGSTRFAFGSKEYTLKQYQGFSQYGVRLPSLDNGTYKVYPASRESGKTRGVKMNQDISSIGYGILRVSDGSMKVSVPSANIPAVSAVDQGHGFYIGHTFQVTADFSNNGDSEIYSGVAVGFMKPGSTSLIARSAIECLDITPGEKQTMTFTSDFYVAQNATLSAGTYTMVIYNATTGRILHTEQCTINANPGAPDVTCTSFTIVGDAGNVNAGELTLKAILQCNSGYMSQPLVVALFEMKGASGTFVEQFSSPNPVFLTSGNKQTVTLTHNFASAKAGKRYAAQLNYLNGNSYDAIGQAYFTVGNVTGVEDVTAEADDAPAEYYDLSGRRVVNPEPGHIYIRRTQAKVEKIVL